MRSRGASPRGDNIFPVRKILLSSILQFAELLRCKTISPVELARHYLGEIERLNPAINAFITVTAESALAQARQAETEIMRGDWRGPLHGIPMGLKDLIDTAGIRTTAASQLFKDRIPTEDAEVVKRLKAAGAILVGKQNLHEFAYGGSSLVSYFGEARNAWNPLHIAGGSSGGSATAVAAGMCLAAIGTDTAGSIREPAALCGVVGLKPTYDAVSVEGVMPLSPSLDHVGPIATTVADCALLLGVITGSEAKTRRKPGNLENIASGADRLRVGVLRAFFSEQLDPEVAAAFEQAATVLSTIAGELHDLDLIVPTDRSLQIAESYASHVEFVRRSPELYQPETVRRIRSGENIGSDEILEQRRELERERQRIGEIFDQVDLLVAPTTPVPAPAIEELKLNPDQLRPREIVLLRNTRPFNVWGLPAISVPCGFTQSGLPIGLQIAGPPHGEQSVFQLARAYEAATTWHMKRPPTFTALEIR